MIAVAYARFSSDKQREESITAQLRAVYEYAAKNKIKIIREYIDEGKSATTDDRPAFQKMISELKMIKPNLVLVHKLDRFSRDRYDSAFYRREIQKAGARLIAVDQPLDDSPESKFLEGILEAQAEFYSRNLAREVMKGMKENAYKAKFNGGWTPLGYDIDKDGNYLVNEEEAATVRLIFNMKLQVKSYTEIITELNARGIKTKRGAPFGKNSIHEILRNEKYCGTYVFNKTPKRLYGKRNNRVKKSDDEIIRVENAIPHIVNKDIWERVQKMMDEQRKGPRERNNDILYILTGIIKCGECGSAMVGNGSSKTVKGECKKYYYYQCNNNLRTQGCRNKKRYPKEKLENAVLDHIQKKVINPDNEEEFANKLWSEIKIINEDRDQEKADLEIRLREVEGKISNIVTAIEDGLEYKHLIPRMNELQENKDFLLNRLSERRSPFEGITRKDVLDYLRKQRGRLIPKNNPEVCKNIVTSYIKEATVQGKDLYIVFKLEMSCDSAGVGGGSWSEMYIEIML